MKLILTATVEHLGVAGDVVEVKDGYGRNYLLPKGYAIAYNRGSAKQIEGIQRARKARTIRDNEHALQVREQLEGLTPKVRAHASQAGKLFGAVTANDIAVAVKKSGGPSIDKRSIDILKPIKNLGRHGVQVKLTEAVKVHVTVEVVAAGE
ncbi:MAG: 50S ribosomal protein L9 [Propionibacterium sp.]